MQNNSIEDILKGKSLKEAADLYYYYGFVSWAFQFNRDPGSVPAPVFLNIKNDDELASFIENIPTGKPYTYFFTKADQLYKELLAQTDNKKEQAEIYLKLGDLYDHINSPNEEILEVTKKAQALFRELDDQEGIASTYMQIAYHHRFRTYDMAEAEKNLTTAREIFKTLNNKNRVAFCTYNIGDIYHPESDTPNLELWEKNLNEAATLFKESDNVESAYNIFSTLAEYFQGKDDQKSAQYLKQAEGSNH